MHLITLITLITLLITLITLITPRVRPPCGCEIAQLPPTKRKTKNVCQTVNMEDNCKKRSLRTTKITANITTTIATTTTTTYYYYNYSY